MSVYERQQREEMKRAQERVTSHIYILRGAAQRTPMNVKFNIIFKWDNLSLNFKMGKMVATMKYV